MEENDFYLRGIESCRVLTDHRPLVGIFRKQLQEISSPRLKRFREALMAYNLNVEWVQGKTHYIADALSRSPVFPGEDEDFDPTLAHVAMCVATDPAFSMLFDASKTDKEYLRIARALERDEKPLAPFKDRWNDLSVLKHRDGGVLIVHGHKIVVPRPARAEILRRLHLSHSGQVKTIAQARQLYYWHGMDGQIRQMVANCAACRAHLPSQPREPSRTTDLVAEGPMDMLSTDLFYTGGRHYLVVVDRFSGFLWIARLKQLDTRAVLHVIRELVNVFGFPRLIFSDNGPQFRQEFSSFCSDHAIEHRTSSPFNPSSNGLAESAVKSAKFLIEKCESENQDLPAALLEWRNTPQADGYSPAQAFFGRRLRTSLPSLGSEGSFDPSVFVAVRAASRADAQRRRDEHAHALTDLTVGDRVVLQDQHSGRWEALGEIVLIHQNGRSYDVELDDGSVIRRNRRLLRPIAAGAQDEPSGAPGNQETTVQPRRSARLAAKAEGADRG